MTASTRAYCYRGCLRPPAFKKLCAYCAARQYGADYHRSPTVAARKRRAKRKTEAPITPRQMTSYLARPDKATVRRALGCAAPVTPTTAIELATQPRTVPEAITPDDSARLAESVTRAIAQKSQQTTPIDK